MTRRLLASLILVSSLLAVQGRAAATSAPVPTAARTSAARDHASDGRVPAGAVPATAARDSAASSTSSGLQGVDVSNWQGAVNWSKVRSAGKSFAFLKATEGKNYVDPYYAQYRSGAGAAGIVIGAYHFARPDLHPATAGARAEADHFVDVAQVGVGDVIPVLDLERGDGLSARTLIDWTWAWLREVRGRTHVKPMIYSGPYRWSHNMDNTKAFAKAGYRLWLADWCSPSSSCPWVPANDWAGRGWSFWQYTDCGHVPGISGCVDLDRFAAGGLRPVRVPLLTVTTNGVGAVNSTPGGISCGSACSSVFNPGSTVTLTPTPDPGAVLVSWHGACSGAAGCQVKALGRRTVNAVFGYRLTASVAGFGMGSVRSSPDGRIDCGGTGTTCAWNYAAGTTLTLTATPQSGSQFDGWSGACSGWELTCSVTMDRARNVTATFADDTPPTATLRTPSRLNGAGIATFDEPVHDVTASNLVIRVFGRTAGLPATVTCVGQRGHRASCATGDVARAFVRSEMPLVPGQDYEVVVDPVGTSPSQSIQDRAGNPAVLSSEAFRAATELDQSALLTGWGWSRVHDRDASSGWYARTDDAGAVAGAGFSGSSVTWHTLAGPGQGVARVLIDGHSVGLFDLSGRVARFAARRFDGLRAGGHTIQVEALGERGAARHSGWSVAVDGLTAGGTALPDSAVVYRWSIVRAAAATRGAYASSDDRGASLGFWFRGTAIRWLTVRGPGQGRAAVYIDGTLHAVYDNYAATRTYGAIRRISGLSDSIHVIRIVALGTARRAARGTAVAIDGFEIT